MGQKHYGGKVEKEWNKCYLCDYANTLKTQLMVKRQANATSVSCKSFDDTFNNTQSLLWKPKQMQTVWLHIILGKQSCKTHENRVKVQKMDMWPFSDNNLLINMLTLGKGCDPTCPVGVNVNIDVDVNADANVIVDANVNVNVNANVKS